MVRSILNLRHRLGPPFWKSVARPTPMATMSALQLAGAGGLAVAETRDMTLTCFGRHPGRRVGIGLPVVACTEDRRLSRRSILLSSVVTSHFYTGHGAQARASMADSKSDSEQPSDFKYIQLWVSADGETHVKECKMKGFSKQAYASMEQFVRNDFGGTLEKMTFTELEVGLEQPLHTCPQVQFVVTLSGSWYIKTTDGTKYVFKPGEVLFQDNTDNTPAKEKGQHYSGVVGDIPCQQFIVQFSRPPEVDNPAPF